MSEFLKGILDNVIAHYVIQYLLPFFVAIAIPLWGRVSGAWSRPTAVVAGIVCLAGLLVIADHVLPRIETGYQETRIKLAQSKGNKLYFESSEMRNIYRWQQVYARAITKFEGKEEVFHNDTFFFIFDEPIQYGFPKINSFGHEFPMYNFYATTNRGAVLQVNGEIKAPLFEIYFPPVEEKVK